MHIEVPRNIVIEDADAIADAVHDAINDAFENIWVIVHINSAPAPASDGRAEIAA